MSDKELCQRDLSVLDLIFDQSAFAEQVKEVVEPVTDEVDIKDVDEGNSADVLVSKQLEVEGVKLTETGDLTAALEIFNKAINAQPHRPSLYNNRAQLYRFMEEDDLALEDLTKAIELSSESYPLTKCRAYCQRGIIMRKRNETESARDDFNESAKLGSKFARQQLVSINPYAKMCNQMVTKLLSDLK